MNRPALTRAPAASVFVVWSSLRPYDSTWQFAQCDIVRPWWMPSRITILWLTKNSTFLLTAKLTSVFSRPLVVEYSVPGSWSVERTTKLPMPAPM